MNAAAGPPVIPTSTNSVNRHSSSPSLLNSDYAISLPYACHDLFLKLVPMMRMPILVPLILRILYPAIPLVALHIDTIMCERSAFAEDQHLWSYFKSLANYYLSITIEVSGYYDSRQEESRQNGDGEWEIFSYTKNRVIAFALYFTQIVSTVCQVIFGGRGAI